MSFITFTNTYRRKNDELYMKKETNKKI